MHTYIHNVNDYTKMSKTCGCTRWLKNVSWLGKMSVTARWKWFSRQLLVTLISLLSDLFSARLLNCDLLTPQRSRRGRTVCSWVRHRGRCGWRLPADSADTQSAPVRSGTFPLAIRSPWSLLLEEPGRSLCDLPCGQSDWDQDPSVLPSGEESDRAEVGRGHLYGREKCLIYGTAYEFSYRLTCGPYNLLIYYLMLPTGIWFVKVTGSQWWEIPNRNKQINVFTTLKLQWVILKSLSSQKCGFLLVTV